MATHDFDLVIIGAGSGGLTAAGFAAQLGAKVALVEKNRIGGDCTWTGCVPSKALLKAAKIAHEVRTASRFGVTANPPIVEMTKVRAYVRQAIQQVYQFEGPEELRKQGIEVIQGAGRFVDARTIVVGEQLVRSKTFLLATGARPRIPPIAGLNEVPFVTYEQIFDNDRLPRAMIVVGGGPIGMEMAQAYQRLGAQVTVVADRLLPKEEPEVRDVMQRVFERGGVRFAWGRAKSARKEGDEIVVATDREEARGELLLIASGRKPTVAGLDLEKAGVNYSEGGIPVDDQLRTNVKNIYAAGDVTGGYQFTHFAGWQAFQAARNALLPGSSSGLTDLVPWVTFTDPEVAHVGLTEEQARVKFGENVKVCRWEMSRTDRAICEDDRDGFVKVIAKKNGILLGATVVNGRAGETITEFIVAMKQNMKVSDLAGAIHAYPTYSTAVQQLAAELAIEGSLSGASGKIIRGLSKIIR
jgi:pyruvate/2-oxoglutarate dehydrogenase complex dihydrolipoamide dehydrogenase (E3) component